jgi:hypothetical protein
MLTEEQQDAFDERKAIMIVDGKIPEHEVDALALIDILEQYPLEPEDGQSLLNLE